MVDPGRASPSARCSGSSSGSSSRRLLGDYLAIVTLFFGQAFVVFTNATDPLRDHQRLQRARERRPAHVLRGPHHDRHHPGLLLVPARRRRRRARRAPLPERIPHRAGLEVVARGSARGGADGDPGQPAEAHGLQLRRRRRGAGRQHLRRRADRRVPADFDTAMLILIYAVLILGGTGSLTGMIVGAIVIIASNEALD